MKSIVLFSLSCLLFLSCKSDYSKIENTQQETSEQFNSSRSIKIKGSETVLPISEKAAQLFSTNDKSCLVSVTGGGSGVGISSLLSDGADIAQTSRSIKFTERQKVQGSGETINEVIIAYDALAVIINPENKVKGLTREQLEGIFRGKITNWKEVGGEDLKIIPYSRETSSGTYEFFKEIVLKNKNFMSGIMSMPANGAVIQSVSQTKGAVAYVGLAYLTHSVRAVSVSFDEGNSFAEPTQESAQNKTYPIIRPLYYYYLSQSENLVKPYIDYILSPTGQKIIEELGFVTI